MKKIAISIVCAFGLFSSVFAQNTPGIEVYYNVGGVSALKSKVGQYNDWYSTGGNGGGIGEFLFDLAYHNLTGNYSYSDSGSRPYFSDEVSEHKITGNSNGTYGIRVSPARAKFLQLGVAYNYQKFDVEKTWASGRKDKETETFGTIMPEMTITYFQRKNFGIYCGGGLGITAHRYKEAYNDNVKLRRSIALQTTAIGIRYQVGPFGAHIEAGPGTTTAVQAGLMFRIQ